MKRPAVDTLMKAYFHQDFDEVYGGMWETVDAFVDDDPRNAARVLAEIPELLSLYSTDEQLEHYLDSLGCMYRFEDHDGGSRQWLLEVADRVHARLPDHR